MGAGRRKQPAGKILSCLCLRHLGCKQIRFVSQISSFKTELPLDQIRSDLCLRTVGCFFGLGVEYKLSFFFVYFFFKSRSIIGVLKYAKKSNQRNLSVLCIYIYLI